MTSVIAVRKVNKASPVHDESIVAEDLDVLVAATRGAKEGPHCKDRVLRALLYVCEMRSVSFEA